jgi:hypothetical protein
MKETKQGSLFAVQPLPKAPDPPPSAMPGDECTACRGKGYFVIDEDPVNGWEKQNCSFCNGKGRILTPVVAERKVRLVHSRSDFEPVIRVDGDGFWVGFMVHYGGSAREFRWTRRQLELFVERAQAELARER